MVLMDSPEIGERFYRPFRVGSAATPAAGRVGHGDAGHSGSVSRAGRTCPTHHPAVEQGERAFRDDVGPNAEEHGQGGRLHG